MVHFKIGSFIWFKYNNNTSNNNFLRNKLYTSYFLAKSKLFKISAS